MSIETFFDKWFPEDFYLLDQDEIISMVMSNPEIPFELYPLDRETIYAAIFMIDQYYMRDL